MTSYDDVKDLILTSDTNTNKNFQTTKYTFTSASVNVANNTFVQRQFTIPLSAETRLFDILVNMSDEDSTYRPIQRFERREVVGLQTKAWALQLSASGGNAALSIYLVNTGSGATENFAAFTVNVIRRDFVDELS